MENLMRMKFIIQKYNKKIDLPKEFWINKIT